MTRYKLYLKKMLDENKQVFDDFAKLHMDYSLEPEPLQEKFNEKGAKVLEIVREYENRLCANTERGMYNKFSSGLAEKFQTEVRKHFPLIDHVGLIVDKPKSQSFTIKKIDLNKTNQS